jgi:hypothetical protein
MFKAAPLFDEIRQILMQKLWVENCNVHHIISSHHGLQVGTRRIGEEYRGDYEELGTVFKKSMRLFHLDGSNYLLLHTISDLQDVLIGAISDEKIKRAVSSREFRMDIAKFCARNINLKAVKEQYLQEADLLLFMQFGGKEHRVLELTYDITVSRQCIAGFQTPYRFLEPYIAIRRFLFQPLASILGL